MNEARAGQQRHRRIQHLVRRLVWFGILGGIAYFFIRYDVDAIPADYDHLAPQHMRAGSSVVSTAFDPDEARIGNVVLYRAPAPFEGYCYGVIVGLPGDQVWVNTSRPGAGELEIHSADGEVRKESLPFPPDMKLASGSIPAGQALILNGDRLTDASTQLPDGRNFGFIRLDVVEKRLLTALNPFQ
ncbi:MAG: hypothetical protein H6807_03740 [Planctomycetes bacterium]|nr:hypothetical protein [Planctomycetota bacterium]